MQLDRVCARVCVCVSARARVYRVACPDYKLASPLTRSRVHVFTNSGPRVLSFAS